MRRAWFGFVDRRRHHSDATSAEGRPRMMHQRSPTSSADSRQPAAAPAPRVVRGKKPLLIFGGAGFVGANLADSVMADGEDVLVFDNLSRPGVERNLQWLKSRHGARLHFAAADLRDPAAVEQAVADAGAIVHLAAQVAVTSSLVDPLDDFAVNAQGTLMILEAMRRLAPAIPLVFASTNKVYGNLEDLAMREEAEHHVPADRRIAEKGIDEAQPLRFCTPYGCSKGTADQYVLDYAHSYGLRTAVLRKSCIYGPRQFGTEDQGWVAHFLIKALRDETITIYGDGKQVRDVLHVADAVEAYRGVLANIDRVTGRAFNVGGGPLNAVSLRVVLDEIAALTGRSVRVEHAQPRTGDQLYFVADTTRLTEQIGWRPGIGWRDGLRDLADWLIADLGLPAPSTRRLHKRVGA